MEQSLFEQLIERFAQPESTGLAVAEISGEELAGLTVEQAAELVERFGGTAMIRLPDRERKFFDWLREHDPSVWIDLWGEEGNYHVSLSHLPSFLPGGRGFPICDLYNQENFFFTQEEITAEDGKIFIEQALDVLAENEKLAMEQAFAIEVWRGPIDQWRFAWMYDLPLVEVKKMVIWLIREGVLDAPRQRAENDPPIEVAPPPNGKPIDE